MKLLRATGNGSMVPPGTSTPGTLKAVSPTIMMETSIASPTKLTRAYMMMSALMKQDFCAEVTFLLDKN